MLGESREGLVGFFLSERKPILKNHELWNLSLPFCLLHPPRPNWTRIFCVAGFTETVIIPRVLWTHWAQGHRAFRIFISIFTTQWGRVVFALLSLFHGSSNWGSEVKGLFWKTLLLVQDLPASAWASLGFDPVLLSDWPNYSFTLTSTHASRLRLFSSSSVPCPLLGQCWQLRTRVSGTGPGGCLGLQGEGRWSALWLGWVMRERVEFGEHLTKG